MSRRACPRPIGDDMYSTRFVRFSGRVQDDQVAACQLRDPGATLPWLAAVIAPVDRKQRAANPVEHGLGLRRRRGQQRCVVIQEQGLRVGLRGPGHAVLLLLGRVRFAEQLAEEELGVTPVVPQHVVPINLRPALISVIDLLEVVLLADGQRRRQERRPAGDVHDAEYSTWMQCHH